MKVSRINSVAAAALLFLLFPPSPFLSASGAQDVVAIKGYNIKPFNDAIAGFSPVCGCRVTELVSSELDEAEIVREIRNIRPAAVFAVGTEALSLAGSIRNIPVIFAMVPNPQPAMNEGKNISGIGMNITPERYLKELNRVLPNVKRVGLVYDPRKTGKYVKKAQDAAGAMGIALTAKEVHGPRDVVSVIQKMKGEIDLFWMLPDSTAITPETVEFLFYFSFENRVPLLAFADKYVDMGALLSLSIDTVDAGRQAGELCRRMLAGGASNDPPGVTAPEKAVLTINLRTAKKMSIPVKDSALSGARIAR
jgi:putative ABC transport system substrate-binding protein